MRPFFWNLTVCIISCFNRVISHSFFSRRYVVNGMYLGSDLTIHKHRHHQPPKKRELHFIFLANAGSASVEKFQIERKNYCDSLKDFPLRWVVSSVYTCDLSDEHHLLAFHLHSLQERLCGSCNTDVQGFSELIHSFRVMLEK